MVSDLAAAPRRGQAAVYAVPDPGPMGVGDQVVAALLTERPLGADEVARFLDEQADLPTKGRPRWVRLLADLDELPRTATTKVLLHSGGKPPRTTNHQMRDQGISAATHHQLGRCSDPYPRLMTSHQTMQRIMPSHQQHEIHWNHPIWAPTI